MFCAVRYLFVCSVQYVICLYVLCSTLSVCMFCAVRYLIIASLYYFLISRLIFLFCFLFSILCIMCFGILFVLFCVLFPILCCFFPISVQVYCLLCTVYCLLPPAGDIIAVNKYNIMLYHKLHMRQTILSWLSFLYERLTGRNWDVRTVGLRNVIPETSVLTTTM
jgi:hypothetical protein